MKKILVCAFASALLLTGCNGVSKNTVESQSNISPRIKVYSDKSYNHYEWWYVVDENTGVVYLQFEGSSQGGITPLLNPDGTPVTKDRLELK